MPTTINLILITDAQLQESAFLNSACLLLKEKNYISLERNIGFAIKNGDGQDDIYLSKTLMNISQGLYEQASNCLNQMNGRYPLLQKLLSIDLSYELQKKKTPDVPNDRFFTQYQALLDEYPENENLKLIVKNRLRYIQHEY